MENPHGRLRQSFDYSMIAIVCGSVFLLLYNVGHDLPTYALILERITIGIFITEFLLRAWLFSHSHKLIIDIAERSRLHGLPLRWWPLLVQLIQQKIHFLRKPMVIIDLLAMLPSYHAVEFLAVFLFFRLLKLFRYTSSLSAFASVLTEKRFELTILSVIVGFVIIIASIAIYIFEKHVPGSHIKDFSDALYWAIVTAATVGYGDITPVTTEGRVVTVLLIVSGVVVISFLTSIVVTAFNEKIHELRKNRVFIEAGKLPALTLVCGFGRIGEVVAHKLLTLNKAFVIIDSNPAAINLAHQNSYLALLGNASDATLLQKLGLGRNVRHVLCLTHDDATNLYITLTVRGIDKSILIISRANQDDTVKKLQLAGATHVIRPYQVVARMAAEYVGQPVAFDALYDVVTGSNDVRIEPLLIPQHSILVNKPLRSIAFSQYNLTLFGVIGNHHASLRATDNLYDLSTRTFYFNPNQDFIVREGDMLVVFGFAARIARFKRDYHDNIAVGNYTA